MLDVIFEQGTRILYSLHGRITQSSMINRRSLKWPSASYKLAGHQDDSSAWNVALVSEALPRALYHTAMHAIDDESYSFDDVMKLFPDKSYVLGNWKNVNSPFYKFVEDKRIFYTNDGGRWVAATEACMIPAQCAQQKVLRKVLLENERHASNLVKPPPHLLVSVFTHPTTVLSFFLPF